MTAGVSKSDDDADEDDGADNSKVTSSGDAKVPLMLLAGDGVGNGISGSSVIDCSENRDLIRLKASLIDPEEENLQIRVLVISFDERSITLNFQSKTSNILLSDICFDGL